MSLEELPCYVAGFRDGLNVRELGGWRGADNRTIRHGLIYRSGRLASFEPNELGRLRELGLRTIVDLRPAAEAHPFPDPPLPQVRILRLDPMRRAAGADLGPDSSLADLVRDKARASAEMAFGNQALRTLFGLLLDDSSAPLLVHCNSGKDRTGVVCAIILMSLGASDQTIVTEYMLSNAYRAAEIAWSQSQVPDFEKLPKPYQELYDVVQGVVALSIKSVLASVDANYATRDRYLLEECGMGAAELTRLRDRYLE